jgi:hypothetical protein
MARHSPLWQQQSSFPAAYDRALLAALWPAGGALGARATAVGGAMQLSLPPGKCAVPLTDGSVALCAWDAAEVVAFQPAPPSGQSRYDPVVCTVRDAAIDQGPNNDFILQAIQGTPAASNPVRPAIPANSYWLYDLLIPGGAANLNGVAIGDRRAPLGPGTGLHCRVARGAAFNVSSGAGTFVAFDTVAEDANGLLAGANVAGEILLPVAGRWQIMGMVTANAPSGNFMNVQVQRRPSGGAPSNLIFPVQSGSVTSDLSISFGLTYVAAAFDQIRIVATSQASLLAGSLGGGKTYLCVDYLGP